MVSLSRLKSVSDLELRDPSNSLTEISAMILNKYREDTYQKVGDLWIIFIKAPDLRTDLTPESNSAQNQVKIM